MTRLELAASTTTKYKDGTTVICEKDFESAAASAIIYAEEHNVSDIEDLLDLIYAHHSHAEMSQNICNICGANYEYRNGRWKNSNCPI